jgi:PAS domain S-box-containing protein
MVAENSFLKGGGEMGRHIRAHDWSRSELGPAPAWPQSLRTVVRVMLNTGLPMYVFWGPNSICLYNDAYSQSIGPERHPCSLGQHGRAVWAEIWDIIGPQIAQVLAGGPATWHENQLVPITRNGQREDVYWTYSFSPIDDEAAPNGVGGVLVQCTETTAHVHKAHRALQEREQFAELFEQAPTFMALLTGPEHRVELVNPGYRQLIGHREIVGRTVAQALPDAVEQGYLELLDEVYRSGKPFAANGARYARKDRDGTVMERFVDFVYQPIKNPAGEAHGIFVVGVDVTERKLAEARRDALARLTDEIRSLETSEQITFAAARILGETLSVSHAGYGAIDADADYVRVAREWMAAGVGPRAGSPSLSPLGALADDLRRGQLIAVDDASTDPRTAQTGAALLQRGAAAFVNVPVIERGALVAVLYVVNAEPRAWPPEDLAFIREVAERARTASERLRTELALRESEARLRKANETLEADVEVRTRQLMAAEEALRHSHKMEAVGQLTGGLAHDFNNLLGAIMGSLEVMRTKMAQDRIIGFDRYVDAGLRAVRRAAALTHRLLAFSRRQTLDPRPTDAARLVHDMEDLIRRTAGPAVELQVAAADGLWPTLVDPPQLENALLNLCINARDAMPGGGRLTIAAANQHLGAAAAAGFELAPGDYLALSVTDTGSGMAPDVIARAFDPFFTTKPLGEGTGLGLSMVYGFARQSGGQIRIESAPGQGTTMRLYLPRYHGVLAEPRQPAAAAIAAASRPGEAVLVVDDVAAIRALIVEVLAHAGYLTIEAEDGPSALRILQSGAKIDLLVTDVGLPGGINGRQVADAGRALRPELKVLFITGYAESAIVGNGALEPWMQLLTKPFMMNALAARVREMLQG